MSTVWYFAYGSNMESATFQGRRGITCRRALAARLPGWQLVLDKPSILPHGGAMANIVATPGATVIGVLYEIGADDLAHLDLTEGVLIGNYQRIAVTVTPLGTDAAPCEAFTLVSDRRDPSLRPTSRYVACLIAGAEENGLPPQYIAGLRALETIPETSAAAAVRAMIDDTIRRRRE